MHPGLWLAFGEISGEDFWRNKAIVKHESFLQAPALSGDKLTFATENSFQTKEGKVLCKQTSRFSLAVRPAGYLLIWEASFAPAGDVFTFGDQEEMGLGVRVATGITEKNGGVIRNSEGQSSAKATWGKPAQWCDYSGTLSARQVGITLMSDPNNFRASWWHNRDYGLMVANPFGRKAMKQGEPSRVEVKKGETFRLRYGVLVRSAASDQPINIDTAYADFLKQ